MSSGRSWNSPMLITNAAGSLANTSGNARAYQNPDPMLAEKNLVSTVYIWALNWGSAQVQLYISPHRKNGPITPVWFPIGSPVTENGIVSFRHRYHQVKAEVTGATESTLGLYCERGSPSEDPG